MENQKIKENELVKLKELTNALSYFKNEIATLVIKKQKAIEAFNAYDKDLSDLTNNLKQEYGDVTINMETGDYVTNEPKVPEKEDKNG